ncbi:hypothetical protein MT356_20595 [Rathayibacter festucae]|uniref:hypothetical protein n=1 Tax=Rathayibacter festucae TaxID=110937 RepID=UPI001FB38AC1|nr:hypothetical protein [Rathayibacter festucae]MCJ1702117.1 hypothetical protein [Rathayibacter festucae]
MDAITITLVEVIPRKKHKYWYAFEPSDRFVKPWWGRECEPDASEHWLSVQRNGVEVARCKFALHPGPQSNPVLGEMPHGHLDIRTLEVALPERGRGIGRDTLQAIRRTYPLPRLTALNDDDHSRGFWDHIGWTRHELPGPFAGAGRVTYSEIGNIASASDV